MPDERLAALATHTYGVDSNWYSDTGATDHITGELDKLVMHDNYSGNDQIKTANGAGMDIHLIGQYVMHAPCRNLVLNNVLHVPQTKKNLVSVHKFTRDNHAFVEYHPDFFVVKDQATEQVLLRGSCRDGLYPFPSSASTTSKHVMHAAKPSSTQWHSRLGHPSLQIVKRVVTNNALPCSSEVSESICDACQQAKSHQLPYSLSLSRSNKPLELIHSDVWGPAIDSFGGKNYYVSFIDDFSKFTWIYLLRHKSEVFKYFHEFQALVERMFDCKIIAMQTDWGGEYEKLNSFFRKLGITHHVSCPYAHQQNGSAERKHRHIVETGLALLAHAHMPLKYWDQAFLAAVYLINRMPTKVLDFSTPLQTLLGKTPDYSSMRTFGCACWPNLRPYNNKKLQFRSAQCVFLGYSNLHKGFKLDHTTGRIYISRGVVFDEHVYPFSKLHSNAGLRFTSETVLLDAFPRELYQVIMCMLVPLILPLTVVVLQKNWFHLMLPGVILCSRRRTLSPRRIRLLLCRRSVQTRAYRSRDRRRPRLHPTAILRSSNQASPRLRPKILHQTPVPRASLRLVPRPRPRLRCPTSLMHRDRLHQLLW